MYAGRNEGPEETETCFGVFWKRNAACHEKNTRLHRLAFLNPFLEDVSENRWQVQTWVEILSGKSRTHRRRNHARSTPESLLSTYQGVTRNNTHPSHSTKSSLPFITITQPSTPNPHRGQKHKPKPGYTLTRHHQPYRALPLCSQRPGNALHRHCTA